MRSFFWHVTLWQKKTCWKVIACMTKVSFRDYIPKRRFQGSHWLLRFNLGNTRLKSWNEISEVIVSNYYKRLFSATAFSNALGKLLFCRKKTHQFLRFNAKISIALHTMLSILCMWSGWILPTVPSPWGALVGLAPQTKPQAQTNWNMKHYKAVECLSIFRMSSPSAQTQSPPIENFLATVLITQLFNVPCNSYTGAWVF